MQHVNSVRLLELEMKNFREMAIKLYIHMYLRTYNKTNARLKHTQNTICVLFDAHLNHMYCTYIHNIHTIYSMCVLRPRAWQNT